MTIQAMFKRYAALLLAAAILLMTVPMGVVSTAAENSDTRVADPSTMDDWKTLFGPDVLSTEHAGLVWTDKSVFTDDDAFDGTGITLKNEDDGFLVALSTIASQADIDGQSIPQEPPSEIRQYMSFVDKIGEHMSVTDIKGILINDTLFSGALLSKNFITGGGDLGTFDSPKPLGDELVWAVQARLGIDANSARDLLGLAYAYGQLSYTNDTDFSNYIGWYANEAGEFLGFWYDGITTMPDPADPQLTDATRPAYIVRSYGFLGAVDEEHGVRQTDLMYATVQVREHIQSGEECMVFMVPSALVPTVTYSVGLDQAGQPTALTVSGAEHPIRLVYEVAADENVNEITVNDTVAQSYPHRTDDGGYVFYTNRFEADHSIGYGKQNTYSYFVPSVYNDYYYYTANTAVYTDTNGTLYRGDALDADVVYYRSHTVYSDQGSLKAQTRYEPISDESIAKAVRKKDTTWYIPAGTVRTMLNGRVVTKTDNVTDTLPFAEHPFVDTRFNYYVGAILGNNGCVTVMPETGIRLSTVTQDNQKREEFTYTLTRTDAAQTAEYEAVLIKENGRTENMSVVFDNGVASVTLRHGETLCITGMPDGARYTVTQSPHTRYKPASVNGVADQMSAQLTVTHAAFAEASFVNRLKGVGSVAVVKRVLHDFGPSYVIPDRDFTLRVELPEEYALKTVSVSHSEDPTLTSVTTDENGCFEVTLSHSDQFELLDLQEDTLVTVTELGAPGWFTTTYYGAGEKDVNTVAVRNNASVSLIVINDYRYDPVPSVPLSVGGRVQLSGRENDVWLTSDIFTLELEQYVDGAWSTIATKTVDSSAREYSFDDVIASSQFDTAGSYNYQIKQVVGTDEGMVYDRAIHTFSIAVGDPDMCGHLEILSVDAYRTEDIVSGDASQGYTVTADFHNIYAAGGRVDVVVDVQAMLENPSASDLVSLAGYRFGLFGDGEETPFAVSDQTDMIGEARLIASFDAVGTYTYILRELIPDAPKAGMQYSEQTYDVTVAVTEENGILSAQLSISDDPVFTNVYAPASAVLMPTVTNTLIGRPLREGEFAFRILSGDTVLANGTNLADGEVVFDEALTFDTVGDYYYDVIELTGDLSGVAYDTMVYHLHITVTDGAHGALEVHYHVINTVDDIVHFVNHYTPMPTSITVSGQKVLVGRELINEEFHFVLVETDRNGRLVLAASNFTDGSFAFDPITFESAGEYRFSVHEVQSSTTHGLKFDTTVFQVDVTVWDDENGALWADVSLSSDGEAVESIEFVNYYDPTPAHITLSGTVISSGRDDEACTVELYEWSNDVQADDVLQTAVVDANGTFVFEELTFNQSGDYHYSVSLQHSGQAVGQTWYDDTVYHVLVRVTDNGRGLLTATATIYNGEEAAEQLLFVNTAAPPASTTTDAQIVTTTTVKATSSVTTTTTVVSQNSPATGESAVRFVWSALLVLSGIVCLMALSYRKTSAS